MLNTRLISYTKPNLAEMDELNVQELLAFAARVSNPTNQNNHETSGKLLNYCMRNKHWSVFELADATIEIKTTRDIGRQILRHRSFSFQEFSQRYADPNSQEDIFEYSEARLQDDKNRQNSLEVQNTRLQRKWEKAQRRVAALAQKEYDWAIKNGIAKELARKVLPEGLTMSCMYMKGSIRSWLHFIDVRTDPSTQKEHRLIAEACRNEISKIVPQIITK